MTTAAIEPVRWGIIGLGNIAHQFATGLSTLKEANLVAVGSRTQAKADAFAKKYQVSRAYASYETLAHDPTVEVVYIATPHPMHAEVALLCLKAGKAVLLEKPFTINANQAERVTNLARARKLFLMEAMWTRFFPLMFRLRQLIADGTIGQPLMLQADFGAEANPDPNGRHFNAALGGGALLDLGVYPISLASMLFGSPDKIIGLAHVGKTGVDEQAAMVLGYHDGRLASLSCSIRVQTSQEAVITGSKGRIKIQAPWWRPSLMTITKAGKNEQISAPYESNGYQFEAQEVGSCLRAGKLESDIMPLNESLQIMQTMDKLRAEWGLKYPIEQGLGTGKRG